MQSQSEFVPKTYGATPFDQFLEWEELPVIRNFVVSDIRKLEVVPWRRRGGLERESTESVRRRPNGLPVHREGACGRNRS